MKDSRIGESLWSIWEGYGYSEALANSIVYVTETHLDLDHEVVRKALASSIQRDGIVYSLSQAFQAIDAGAVCHGWIGLYSDEMYETVCDESGLTEEGVQLEAVIPVTFVEVPDLV